MELEIKIPFDPDGDLAKVYNEAVDTSVADWVLLLDHDVFLRTNPRWRYICGKAIEQVEDKNCGLLICVTSYRGGRPQESRHKIDSTDLLDHMDAAERTYEKFGLKLEKANSYKIAGFFMLVNKLAWQNVKFEEKYKGQSKNRRIQEIDWFFCQRLMQAGYSVYVMKGLYVYHMKDRKNRKDRDNA